MASQSIVISAVAGSGDDDEISSGNGSPVPPENPEVTEEFAIDSAVSIQASLVRSSSLWTLRDRVGFFQSSGGGPTRRSVLDVLVKWLDKAVILVDGEVGRWSSTSIHQLECNA
jgi:hypothetical protein